MGAREKKAWRHLFADIMMMVVVMMMTVMMMVVPDDDVSDVLDDEKSMKI